MKIAGTRYEKIYDEKYVKDFYMQRWRSDPIKYKGFDLVKTIAAFNNSVELLSIANITIETISYDDNEIFEFHLEFCIRVRK